MEIRLLLKWAADITDSYCYIFVIKKGAIIENNLFDMVNGRKTWVHRKRI